MQRKPVIPDSVSSFYDYFDLKAPVRDILQVLGYGYQIEQLVLPQSVIEGDWVAALQERLGQLMTHIPMDNEATKREFLIAPILSELALRSNVLVQVEFAIDVSTRLKGSLDYLLTAGENLVIVEAKQGDMPRGMRQLAAELVAVDQWTESESPTLYGALSVGDAWRFAMLERPSKVLHEDIKLFAIPNDLSELMSTLNAILAGTKK
ncbi:hypothetical protein [Armatimonas sp.]|uniref:hypothetical protein n=1 Tax=Armatimonas sp. TaxID=1872638 RepID=UPI003750DB9D